MKKDILKSVMLALCMLVSFYANAHDFEIDGIYYNILTTTEVEVTFKGSYYSEFSEYKGKVEIPESISYDGSTYSVTSIGNYAFTDCTGLTSITIPNSVTRIGGSAFYGCTGLTSITIPNSVTSISSLAFKRCTGLASITVDAGNAVYDSRENCNAIIEKETNSLIFGCKNTVIPNSVTSIGHDAFGDCTGLTSVTIPNSVTSIGTGAFKGCTGLASITIPNSVTSIGDYAFYGCTGIKIVINISSLNISAGSSLHGYVAYYADKVITDDEQIGDFIFKDMELVAYTGNDKEVKLPNNYKGGNYTIGEFAFKGCTGLTSITIPNSVTSIGRAAFNGCTGLTSITIPNSVTSIGYSAFSDCTGLTSITIPNSVTSIGTGAFEGCTGLTSINIPNSVTSTGDYAFSYCTGLASVTIPNSVTSIGGHAFSGCTGLTSITIPNSVTSIGGCAFVGCTGLTSITIPNSVTSIGDYAFSYCTGLASITVDDGNAVYDSRENCNAIIEKETNSLIVGCKNTVIPNSVTSIGGCAFEGCTGLTSITIPNSVTSIESGAFSGCTGLTSITVDDGNAVYDSRENCNAIIEKETNSLILGCKNTTIPNSVTSIGGAAFYGCDCLTSITIPNSVTSIGDDAFYGCTGLASVTIPNSVTSIGTWAFYGCTGLASVTIPNSVTSIESGAFSGCTGLTSVTIPNSVTSIGTWAFYGCEGLKTVINCSSLDISAGSSLHGYVAYYADKVITADEQIGDFIFKDMELVAYTGNDKEVKLPNNYKGGNYTIGDDAFYGCAGLTSITIPNSVTSIGDEAFCWCAGLTSINIPNSVTSIGDYAFRGCTGLTSITVDNGNAVYDSRENCNAIIEKETNSLIIGCKNTVIPNSVTSIGYEAFGWCAGLTSVTIPNSVTSIGDYAFYDCTGLASITVDAGNAVYDSRENCNAIIEKETNSLIIGCKNTVIPNSVTSIGYCAFCFCTGLTSITIPNSVTSIGVCAFWGCEGLTSITIPNSVTSIGNDAFNYCDSLSEIYSNMEDPCACPSDVVGSPTLYVPAGTADKYIAQGWDEWASEIVEVEIDISNTLSVSDVKVTHGASVILPVSMENEESITAFQFEVSLPEGASLVSCELTDRKSDQMLSFSELPNGNYQVAALSLTSKAFKDSEGALVNLQLATEKEMEAGEYNVTVKNIELTTTDEDALHPADCTAKLTVTDVMVGDSNGDGKISITDAVAIVNYILNKPSSSFAVEAADVNMDAKVTITDAVAIVNKILAGTTEAKSRAADMQLDPQ